VSVGIGLADEVGVGVRVAVWEGIAVLDAVADGLEVEDAVEVIVAGARGLPGTASPAAKPATSAKPAMGRAISRLRATAPI
jgi:hypothetical protein